MTELAVFAAVVFFGTVVMCAVVIWRAARQADRERDVMSRPDSLAALERMHQRVADDGGER